MNASSETGTILVCAEILTTPTTQILHAYKIHRGGMFIRIDEYGKSAKNEVIYSNIVMLISIAGDTQPAISAIAAIRINTPAGIIHKAVRGIAMIFDSTPHGENAAKCQMTNGIVAKVISAELNDRNRICLRTGISPIRPSVS